MAVSLTGFSFLVRCAVGAYHWHEGAVGPSDIRPLYAAGVCVVAVRVAMTVQVEKSHIERSSLQPVQHSWAEIAEAYPGIDFTRTRVEVVENDRMVRKVEFR